MLNTLVAALSVFSSSCAPSVIISRKYYLQLKPSKKIKVYDIGNFLISYLGSDVIAQYLSRHMNAQIYHCIPVGKTDSFLILVDLCKIKSLVCCINLPFVVTLRRNHF